MRREREEDVVMLKHRLTIPRWFAFILKLALFVIPFAFTAEICWLPGGVSGGTQPIPEPGATLYDHENIFEFLVWQDGTYGSHVEGQAYYTDSNGGRYHYLRKQINVQLEELCNGRSSIDYDQITYLPQASDSFTLDPRGGYATGILACPLNHALWAHVFWDLDSYSTPDFHHTDHDDKCHLLNKGPTGIDICGQWGV